MTGNIVVILFVICLDIAFILIIRGDFQHMLESDATRLETANSVGPLLYDPVEPVVAEDAETLAAAEEPQKFQALSRTRLRFKNPSVENQKQVISRRDLKRRVAQPAYNTFAVNEPLAGFADTIIWYRNAGYEKGSQSDQLPARIVNCNPRPTPTKKRSVIKKAAPILKKPYDWLKDLVSE